MMVERAVVSRQLAPMTAGAGGQAVRRPPDAVVSSDLDGLYRDVAKQLERIVRVCVQAPEPLIEDACQFAWVRLVHHQARVRQETALAWLVRTALHEAFKLIRRGRREPSLDAELDDRGELLIQDLRPGPHDVCEQRERLRGIAALPTRQQRHLWLYGLGFKYEEIAERDRVSSRTVERQLQQARTSLREAAGD